MKQGEVGSWFWKKCHTSKPLPFRKRLFSPWCPQQQSSHAVKHTGWRRGHAPALWADSGPSCSSHLSLSSVHQSFPGLGYLCSAAKGQGRAQLWLRAFQNFSPVFYMSLKQIYFEFWGMQVSERIISKMRKTSLCYPTFCSCNKSWT